MIISWGFYRVTSQTTASALKWHRRFSYFRGLTWKVFTQSLRTICVEKDVQISKYRCEGTQIGERISRVHILLVVWTLTWSWSHWRTTYSTDHCVSGNTFTYQCRSHLNCSNRKQQQKLFALPWTRCLCYFDFSLLLPTMHCIFACLFAHGVGEVRSDLRSVPDPHVESHFNARCEHTHTHLWLDHITLMPTNSRSEAIRRLPSKVGFNVVFPGRLDENGLYLQFAPLLIIKPVVSIWYHPDVTKFTTAPMREKCKYSPPPRCCQQNPSFIS